MHLKRLGTVAPRKTSSASSGTQTVSEYWEGREGGSEGRGGAEWDIHWLVGVYVEEEEGEGRQIEVKYCTRSRFLISPCESTSCLVFMQHDAWPIIRIHLTLHATLSHKQNCIVYPMTSIFSPSLSLSPSVYTLQLQAPQPQAALCPTEVCFWCTSVPVYFRSCFSFNSVIFPFRSKASQLTMDESELLIISPRLH